jgi:hypothetical protein
MLEVVATRAFLQIIAELNGPGEEIEYCPS